jgi:uncharacterized coiled-coil DUF342 family protein
MNESQIMLTELENKIQKLIYLHEELKSKLNVLSEENQSLKNELSEEREKMLKMKEGYSMMKEAEKSSSNQSIGQLKKKINDIISEIDKSVALMSEIK